MNPDEHPTPNIEWLRESSLTSMFDVRCFPSVQGFQRPGDDKKSEAGFPPEPRWIKSALTS
jgi:hypothetical protein